MSKERGCCEGVKNKRFGAEMKTTSWSFGGNALPEWRSGHIYLFDEPWWLAFCGWFIWTILGRGCQLLHWIKLPRSFNVTIDGETMSWRDYYGDVGFIYHCHVFNPCFQWHEGHPKRKQIIVDLGYDRIREIFEKHDPEYFVLCEDHPQLKS